MNFKPNFKHVAIILGFILCITLFGVTAHMTDNHPNMEWIGLWIGDYIITLLVIILVGCAFNDLNDR